ncbi:MULTISPECIES: PIN-like domain-containing protein [unclassified Ensifer]|uniref:PIN-like domain-containing protein n=1 Tax=unclassified Ensifer TaxID=2633371 RepID=UPI00070919B3|nr:MULTISPECIES: PIN-like domain-containing protein [unclassified Ensifer]KQW62893.1 hypothetical protein ASD02_01885 [Ensifer sp. Root1252]KRC83714.1 hypothetical protein ASE32_01875 [Ensifer sp. Root231]KRD04067.1 hypothetical protein ASE47_00535 [Ensifer sp. Root258]
MRDMFPGFYRPSEVDYKRFFEKGIFVLDTNVLLNFYRYPKAARDEFFSVFDEMKDRLWIPYQVALEFQRLRLKEIGGQKSKFHEVRKAVTDARKSFMTLQTELHNRHSLIDATALVDGVKDHVDQFLAKLETLEQEQPDVHEDDPVRSRIETILSGKVGQRPSQKDVDEFTRDGDTRYKAEVPPGFGDAKKTDVYSYGGVRYESKYGDLILWRQILDHVRSVGPADYIFVTDDKKRDWWWDVDGKTVGPRPELAAELAEACAGSSFYMYKPDAFLSHAKSFLKTGVDERTISQVREVSRQTEYEELSHQHAMRSAFLKNRFPNWEINKFVPGSDISLLHNVLFDEYLTVLWSSADKEGLRLTLNYVRGDRAINEIDGRYHYVALSIPDWAVQADNLNDLANSARSPSSGVTIGILAQTPERLELIVENKSGDWPLYI